MLNVVLSYLDHHSAGIACREGFSFSRNAASALYPALLAVPGVRGAVLLSTCSRTELYFSLEDGAAASPWRELCRACGRDPAAAEPLFSTLRGHEALRHLCGLASGLLSQIWGEDQILAQVKDAIALARENHAADSILEVLFRTAVTAGKRVRTEVPFHRDNGGCADAAAAQVQKLAAGRRVLVIGNGTMGRLTAQRLCAAGFRTQMTLRRYKYRDATVPPGVAPVEYEDRYRAMDGCAAVVSATVSPHHTVVLEPFLAVPHRPPLLVDLAVPRDIDPRIAALPDVRCLDVDQLGPQARDPRREEAERAARAVIRECMDDFDKWYTYRARAHGAAAS